ncbi:Na+/H+ antiporter NhaC family protein, partial [Vibrio alginolyticus]|nr:Na+/H+ antiporter NhaC family protein [Vibrio alginolyticus]MDW2126860.1 Na+/H+ antiporter NhaC family protein [Vibrio sp. 2033]MDW2227406.1 Na+/H+ antiporter NhaC family protein [Vibrio sp. 1761]
MKVGEISLLTSLIIIFVVYMSGSQQTTKTVAPSAVALIPLIVFLALFIGV